MKVFKKVLLAAAACTALVSAQASTINVGGVVWDPDLPVLGADKDFTGRFSFNQWFNGYKDPKTVVDGDTLQGTGEFTSWNGNDILPNSTTGGSSTSFCPGCEVTFVFGGLVVDSTKLYGLDFSSAFLNVWVGSGSDINYKISANPLNIAGASDGTLFLGLSVVDLAFTPIGGNGFANGALNLSLQATSGIAKGNFDTNSLGFGFDLGSSASAQFDLTNITGGTTANQWVATSTGQVKGESIPEPATLALVGLGLLGAGIARRKSIGK